MRADGALYSGFKLGRGNRFAYSRISPRLLPMGDSAGESLIAGMTFVNDYSPTFTRASSAYDPFNHTTVSTNARRRRSVNVAGRTYWLDLMEPARTNLFLRSQDMGNASWAKTDTTVTSGAANAPDGTATLDLMTEGSAGTATVNQSVTITAGVAVAYSRYFKAGNTPWMRMVVGNGSDLIRAWFNLSTGAKGSTSTGGTASAVASTMVEEPLGSGIYRCTLTGIVNAGSTSVTARLQTATADGGSTPVSGGTYYTGWAQLEAMSASSTTASPTSYIATTTATVTRSGDVLTSAYALAQAGSLHILFVPPYWTSTIDGVFAPRFFDVGSAATTLFITGPGNMSLRADDTGHTNGNLSMGADGLVAGTLSAQSMAWDATSTRAYLAGVLKATQTIVTAPWLNTGNVRVGGPAASSNNGWVGVWATPNVYDANGMLALSRASRLGNNP